MSEVILLQSDGIILWTVDVLSQKGKHLREAVQRGEMSTHCTREEHGVPRSTLQDKASGKRSVDANTGSHCRLLRDEESRLADFVCGCASIGYAKSRKEVLAIVQQIINSRGAKTEVTKGW